MEYYAINMALQRILFFPHRPVETGRKVLINCDKTRTIFPISLSAPFTQPPKVLVLEASATTKPEQN